MFSVLIILCITRRTSCYNIFVFYLSSTSSESIFINLNSGKTILNLNNKGWLEIYITKQWLSVVIVVSSLAAHGKYPSYLNIFRWILCLVLTLFRTGGGALRAPHHILFRRVYSSDPIVLKLSWLLVFIFDTHCAKKVFRYNTAKVTWLAF